jgi:hypothetical protein
MVAGDDDRRHRQRRHREGPGIPQQDGATTATNTGSAASVASGTVRSRAPSPVATPLPPRKPRKIDQQLPTTAATVEAATVPDSPPASADPSITAR